MRRLCRRAAASAGARSLSRARCLVDVFVVDGRSRCTRCAGGDSVSAVVTRRRARSGDSRCAAFFASPSDRRWFHCRRGAERHCAFCGAASGGVEIDGLRCFAYGGGGRFKPRRTNAIPVGHKGTKPNTAGIVFRQWSCGQRRRGTHTIDFYASGSLASRARATARAGLPVWWPARSRPQAVARCRTGVPRRGRAATRDRGAALVDQRIRRRRSSGGRSLCAKGAV